MAEKIIGPANPHRASEYRLAKTMGQQLNESCSTLVTGPDAPDPQGVAAAIARLTAGPTGDRPA